MYVRPGQLLPGISYLITRRCTQRNFLLRPSEHTNKIFEYCLAFGADRFAQFRITTDRSFCDSARDHTGYSMLSCSS
jgi:hypothetical protein